MIIAGAVYPDEIPEVSATRRMLRHSPFVSQVRQDGRFELGKASSVLKPTSGYLVLLDGHIVNTEEINREIIQHNPALPHRSVEESIASLFSIHQEEAFTLLNGNFVLAIYDEKKQELFLIRDRARRKRAVLEFEEQLVPLCQLIKNPSFIRFDFPNTRPRGTLFLYFLWLYPSGKKSDSERF